MRILVLFTDERASLHKQAGVFVEPLTEQGRTECPIYFALPGMGGLPTVESALADYGADVIDDALKNNRCLIVVGLLKKLRQRRLAPFESILYWEPALLLDDVLGEFERAFRNSMLTRAPW